MDKNSIKKYAVWARNELIARVAQKANQYGITEAESISASADSIHGKLLTPTEKKQRAALIEKIKNKGKNGFQLVMEEVAYTWFNRFTAIRFMEVNGYLPSHVRVFTDEENHFAPQILAEAIHLDMPGLDMEKVFELKQANKTEELYKYLIITQCNALNDILPGMFQKIEDYTELLLPDNLLREGSVIEQMITLIPEEDWTDQVQIIGWLYQYYNTEPKDLVFANLKKNIKITKENIPAATQIFTPDWIVRYMVENSLGRLWLEGHPNDELRFNWKYYLDEVEQNESVKLQLDTIRRDYANLKPEEIKVIDPCMGSGHILCYMFDVLVQIYEAYGYTARDAASLIVKNNIFGLDIDDRASQLSYFAIMMKARQYDRRFLSRKVSPNVFSICESNFVSRDAIHYFANGNDELRIEIEKVISLMHDAKEYGSIIQIDNINFELLFSRFDAIADETSLFQYQTLSELLPIVKVAETMSLKYHAVITNPPYMGAGGMSDKLLERVKSQYPDTKSDLSTVLMERTLSMCRKNGYMAMINIPVWMFLSTYEKMRDTVIANNTIQNMLHFGRGVFGSDFGTTAFVIRRNNIVNYKAKYRRLFEKQGAVDSVETKEKWFFEGKGEYISTQHRFVQVPGNPVAYWMSDAVESDFINNKPLSSVADIKQGLKTGDNDKFLRLWFEIPASKFSMFGGKKWFPCNKGGDYRRWYGNNDYVINWENDGYELKNFRHPDGRQKSRPQNLQYQFREGLTYTNISSSKFGIRYCPQGFAFDAAGSMIFTKAEKLYYLLGLLSSNTVLSFTSILSPTMSFEVGQIANIPYIDCVEEEIDVLVKQCIEIAKNEWDAYETSWDFETHPLVALRANIHPSNNSVYIKTVFDEWKRRTQENIAKLQKLEERINVLFMDIYGLSDEIVSTVNAEDITLRVADIEKDIRSFVSFAVGCMLGRYSLDIGGLVCADKEINQRNYITFEADKDNVLPICDDDYFEDDIVGKFVKFVETVYGKETLEDNLKYIADALGGNGSPRDVIRSYFLNEFYADHCSTYQVTGSGKRPIYWQFDSGKKNGFKCLIYMHRYQPDTIARIRTDYVHEQQARYRTAIADLEQRIQVATTSERVKLTKLLQKLKDQETEIRLFEEKIHHLADQMIRIDLDDGVKHNYEIFKDVLTKIK